MIRHVFLDVDDTLLDFAWQEDAALHRTYAELGLPLTDEMYARYHEINQGWWQTFERGEVTRETLLVARHAQMLEEYSLPGNPEEMERRYRHNLGIGHHFMPHAESLLQYLRPKYRLYIASNGVGQTQQMRLADAGLQDFFDGQFISEEIGAYKPMPEFFERSFAQIKDFCVDEAILIGDSLTSDILGANRVGMKTVWCNLKGKDPREDIKPTYEVHSLTEIMEIL